MRDLALLFVHLLATIARLFGPGGARSVIAESALVKHQLLVLNRSRTRAPRLRPMDRVIVGLCAIWIRPARLLRSAIVLKPSTILKFHRALVRQKYHLLFTPKTRGKPGPKGPSRLTFLGRIGLMMHGGGQWNGARIVSEDWVRASTTVIDPVTRDLNDRDFLSYGYHWWVPKGSTSEFMSLGFAGQMIFVDTQHDVMIVHTMADPNVSLATYKEAIALFRELVRM